MAKSNLFYIDEESILRTLSDANIGLTKRRDALLRKQRSLSDKASTAELDEVIGQLRRLRKDATNARASDGRSFRQASKLVKEFFDEFLAPLDSGIDATTRLARVRAQANATASAPVIVTSQGEIACEAGVQTERLTGWVETWAVSDFDLNTLDLNMLKGYFTDFQINMALKKHLEARGPNKLSGVSYEKELKPR
ncbi:MAG: hypothetical protein V2I39_00615 [Erythrobacter sp.]|jgi:hypothetical protein|nr:hypothetical protein [Erythrobacter sp.]